MFLDILCHSERIHYLSTYFLTMLRLEKNWPRLKQWFSSSPEKTRPHKPAMDSTAILIPCHVGGNHWVALVWRIIEGQVHFFYSDDLDSSHTEQAVKSLLQQCTDTVFFPSTAKWVHCKSITYRPQSIECGPWTLLALAIMGLHPTPNDAMLLPYMNSNLVQILRTWVASSVITGKVKLPAAIEGPKHSNTTDRGNPKTLVNWSRPTVPIVQYTTTT